MEALTDDEYSVLYGVWIGKSTREIWETIGCVSEAQIKTWRKSAFKKIGARNKFEAIKILWGSGWRK